MSTDPKSIRWWPAALLDVLAVVALVAIWMPDSAHRQKQVTTTAAVLFMWFLGVLIWFFALSRLNRKIRLRGFVVFIGLTVSLFRIRGFSGDLVPEVEWRWSSPASVSGDVPETLNLLSNYPQFLGPQRNATRPSIVLEPDWEQHPPKLLWRKTVGEAWSAFAVSGRSAVTQEQQEGSETVVCYDLLTGQEKWRHKDPTRYAHPLAGIGPRATPTITNNRVYTFGATGILNCLDLTTGEKIWSRNTVEEANATIAEYGMSSSPLVLDDKVIVGVGGSNNQSLMAYNKHTGTVVWGGGNAHAGYSSPNLATLAQTEQILIFNHRQVAGHDPASASCSGNTPGQTPSTLPNPFPCRPIASSSQPVMVLAAS